MNVTSSPSPRDARARLKGASGELFGHYREYRLSVDPIWHQEPAGAGFCAGMDRNLDVELFFIGASFGTGEQRALLEGMVPAPVELRLDRLVFRGLIRNFVWSQQVAENGTANAASVHLSIHAPATFDEASA